jgi:hypothetical protein
VTAHERRLLAQLVEAISSRMTRQARGMLHYRDCRVTTWVDGYRGPHGAPCSPRCAEDRALVAEAGALLAEAAVVQLELRAS